MKAVGIHQAGRFAPGAKVVTAMGGMGRAFAGHDLTYWQQNHEGRREKKD